MKKSDYFGATWAKGWCERFFAHPGFDDIQHIRLTLLADLLCFRDNRLSVARVSCLMLELARNWEQSQLDEIASFLYYQALRMRANHVSTIRRPAKRKMAKRGSARSLGAPETANIPQKTNPSSNAALHKMDAAKGAKASRAVASKVSLRNILDFGTNFPGSNPGKSKKA